MIDWKPGMIAVCVAVEKYPDIFKVGGKYLVSAVLTRSQIRNPIADFGLIFSGIPRFINGARIVWASSRFRPLDDGDIQGLREKYGVPGKAIGGRVVAERGVSS